MRRLEHADGKFWAVETTETGLSIKWGPIGTYGQRREMPVPRAQTAAKLAELVAKQIALGYRELPDPKSAADALVETMFPGERWYRNFKLGDVENAIAVNGRHLYTWRNGILRHEDRREFERARDDARSKIVTWLEGGMIESDGVDPHIAEQAKLPVKSVANPGLVEQCRATPDDPAPFSVYVDWLLENNDPIAETIAAYLAGKEPPIDLRLGGQVELTAWRHGFPTAAAIKVEESDDLGLDELVAKLLAHPLCAFLVHFQLGLASFSGDNTWAPTLRAITSAPNGAYAKTIAFDH